MAKLRYGWSQTAENSIKNHYLCNYKFHISMKGVSLSKFVDDIRGIVRKYRTEAAYSLNVSIIHERWEIGQRIVE